KTGEHCEKNIAAGYEAEPVYFMQIDATPYACDGETGGVTDEGHGENRPELPVREDAPGAVYGIAQALVLADVIRLAGRRLAHEREIGDCKNDGHPAEAQERAAPAEQRREIGRRGGRGEIADLRDR